MGVLGFSAGTLAHVQPGNLELGLCRGQFRPGALGPKVAEQAEATTGPDPAYRGLTCAVGLGYVASRGCSKQCTDPYMLGHVSR